MAMLSSLIKSFFGQRAVSDDEVLLPALQRVYRLQQEGDLSGALEACQDVLSRHPRHARAHFELGRMYGQAGDLDSAFHHLQRAITLTPEFGGAHAALGNVHGLRGDKNVAEACYRAALALDPDIPEAHHNLALFLKRPGRFDEALRHFERAAALAPDFSDATKERALCLIHLARYGEAEGLLGRELVRHPDTAALHACMGLVCHKTYRLTEALVYYETAQRLGPVDAEFYLNLGAVLQDLGRIDEALGWYDRAIASQPDPKLRKMPIFQRALIRLLTGDFSAWPDYEIRLEDEELPRRDRAFPRWTGEDPAGHIVLIHGEQGLGDEIMFASCLPEVISRAKHCVIECAPKLESIFRRSFPAATVYAATARREVLNEAATAGIDCEVPVGSLPLYFRRQVADFPRHGGYLQADCARVEYWKRQLASLGAGIKVGISWRGGSLQTRSPLRSIPLEQWLPILRTGGAQFVSLQYDASGNELDRFRADCGIGVRHWPDAIADYDETAALVSALDLIISVCTAAIHLGGALGRPVWVMAPYSPEWRYGFAGETMPWYPSVRIFRQPAFGEWMPVVGKVAQHLRELSDLGH
jgi:tetratricopeptide (TPR) repeat protein